MLLLFSYSCPYFPPLLSAALCCPIHPSPHLPHSILPTLLSQSVGPLCMFLDFTLPLLSPFSPSHPSSLVTVTLFFISMSLVLFCSLVCFVHQVPHLGEIKGIHLSPLGLFHLAYALQFHPCCRKGQKFLLSLCCVVFHCVNIPQVFDPLIY